MHNELIETINEAILLNKFKKFCEYNNNINSKNKIRCMLYNSRNQTTTILSLFKNDLKIDVQPQEEKRMTELVLAFINKSNYRKNIPNNERYQLLKQQDNKCNICKTEIDIHAAADHIVPFKYVGDELKNNIQMLCKHCNSQKNANLDYQIKIYIEKQ